MTLPNSAAMAGAATKRPLFLLNWAQPSGLVAVRPVSVRWEAVSAAKAQAATCSAASDCGGNSISRGVVLP